MKKAACLIGLALLLGATMWGQQRVAYLYQIKQLPVGTEFEYDGLAKVYNNNYGGMTLDDNTAFITFDVVDNGLRVTNVKDDAKPQIPVKTKDFVGRFKGKVLGEGEYLLTPGPNHGYSAELSSIEYSSGWDEYEMPYVLASAGEKFSDYNYRPCIFRNVKVSKYDLALSDVAESYEVLDENGAKGIFIAPASAGNDLTGEYAWIKCTPVGGGYPYPATYVGLENVELGQTPIAELTKAAQINDIEEGNSFVFNGEAVVYFCDGTSITLDNGEDYVSLGLEYFSEAKLPQPGDVITSFTGRISQTPTGLEVAGGRHFSCFTKRINCSSIVTTGETRELVSMAADPALGFKDYCDRLVTFHNVTVTFEDLKYVLTLPNGSQAYGHLQFDPNDDKRGVYDEITCVPLPLPLYPGAELRNVTFGDKAGVGVVAADNAAEYEYFDLQGRHISNPTTPGIYLMKGSDGTVKKLKL